jgi:hypothetical protein
MAAQVSAPLEDDSMIDDGFADDVRVRLLVLRCIRLERLLEQALPCIQGAPRGLVTAIENAIQETS